MAEPTLAEFRTRFPEFVSEEYPDSEIELWLQTALGIHRINPEAVMFLTAHLMVVDRHDRGTGVAGVDGGRGEVSSEAIGPKSVSYVTQAGRGGDSVDRVPYTRTYYGRMFLQLESRTPARRLTPRVW